METCPWCSSSISENLEPEGVMWKCGSSQYKDKYPTQIDNCRIIVLKKKNNALRIELAALKARINAWCKG